MIKKVMLYLILVILTSGMQWFHWWCHASASGVTSPKVILHLISIVLSWGMQWCHQQWHWEHMMPLPVASHDQKYISPHFNHFNIRCIDAIENTVSIMWCQSQYQWCHMTKALVLLILPSLLCDMNTGITWSEKSFWALFQSCQAKKQNGAIDSAIYAMWCGIGANSITWPRVIWHLVWFVFT